MNARQLLYTTSHFPSAATGSAHSYLVDERHSPPGDSRRHVPGTKLGLKETELITRLNSYPRFLTQNSNTVSTQ
jgi:hypothetical protein